MVGWAGLPPSARQLMETVSESNCQGSRPIEPIAWIAELPRANGAGCCVHAVGAEILNQPWHKRRLINRYQRFLVVINIRQFIAGFCEGLQAINCDLDLRCGHYMIAQLLEMFANSLGPVVAK